MNKICVQVYDKYSSLIYGVSEGIAVDRDEADAIFARTFQKLPFKKILNQQKSEASAEILKLIFKNEKRLNNSRIEAYKFNKAENYPLLYKLHFGNESIEKISEEANLSKSQVGKQIHEELKKFRQSGR